MVVVGSSLTVGSGIEFIVWLAVSAGLIAVTVVVLQIAKRRARRQRGETAED